MPDTSPEGELETLKRTLWFAFFILEKIVDQIQVGEEPFWAPLLIQYMEEIRLLKTLIRRVENDNGNTCAETQ